MATGIVDTVDRRTKQSGNKVRVTVVVDRPESFHAGDTVEVRKVLTDEEIGRQLRAMLLAEGVDKDSLRDLVDNVGDYAGWPVLADLIRDVGGI